MNVLQQELITSIKLGLENTNLLVDKLKESLGPLDVPPPPPPPVEPPVEPPPPVDPPPPPVEPPVVVEPTAPKSRYRNGQELLFQAAGPLLYSGITGAPPFDGSMFGPSMDYVDSKAGWPWNKRGGDWLDADNIEYGTKPWSRWTQPALMVKDEVAEMTFDVTTMVNRDGWLAWRLHCPNAQRKVLSSPTPTMLVTYEDGSTSVETATIIASIGSGKTTADLRTLNMSLPVLLEFKRLSKKVVKAELKMKMTGGEWPASGGMAKFDLMVLNPPMNNDPVTLGLSKDYTLDAGIKANVNVIHAHVYGKDGKLSDFVSDIKVNTDAEKNFDPSLIDHTKPQDLTKLPHTDLGKWVGITSNWSYVKEGAHKFKPLHPDLGAIRVKMNKAIISGTPIDHGSVVGYGGSLSSHAFLYMPADKIYKQRRLFVRNYMRITYVNGKPKANDRKQVYTDKLGGQLKWSELGGKFGLTPGGHHNTYGGFSGSAGGPSGTQFRSGWIECTEDNDGPGTNGFYVSSHIWDFGQAQPPGYNYGATLAKDYCWGQRGGLGGVLYADNWYCIESECLLNSVDQEATLADGSKHIVNGVPQLWTPDGEMRTWIDGRLVFERKGMVFRTLPALNKPYNPNYSRPIAPIGHVYAGMNIFHGGVTQDCLDRYLDINGVVVSESYIGPMKGLE